MMEKRGKGDGHISDEEYLHLKNGIHLILIFLEIFTIIILKKMYYY